MISDEMSGAKLPGGVFYTGRRRAAVTAVNSRC